MKYRICLEDQMHSRFPRVTIWMQPFLKKSKFSLALSASVHGYTYPADVPFAVALLDDAGDTVHSTGETLWTQPSVRQ